MLLHTVSQSPFSSTQLRDAVDASVAGDSILLFGDAVYATVKDGGFSALIDSKADVSWYVIEEDCEIRGINGDAIHSSATRIDYDKFVKLVIDADSTIAW